MPHASADRAVTQSGTATATRGVAMASLRRSHGTGSDRGSGSYFVTRQFDLGGAIVKARSNALGFGLHYLYVRTTTNLSKIVFWFVGERRTRLLRVSGLCPSVSLMRLHSKYSNRKSNRS